ncbi:transcriptional regulator, IclR family [Halogranum rubrum]|uniref:Transcriptional regulator, IclR family n=2 Tax=Halogranum rubrum TaxID=553466 RepID=A0A1I4BLK6_9EURY|nr:MULTISPECIES: IclR family transcriptional regulator [Halogranum]EJN57949.1 ArcR family transcription regulator [Halogranum salarium B-1]SFK68856.1 transcriptional regulator, IclR family [Halogranum rubrum]
MSTNDGRRTLKSSETTLEILDRLKDLDGARVTELAEDLERAPSTIHSHLTTLKANGYVVKEGDIYHLGLHLLELGNYVQNRKKAYRISKGYTEQLAEESKCRAVFVVEENGRGVYLHTYSGKHAVWQYSTLGKQFYLHQTAAGKALLSTLSDERVEEIIDRWELPAKTENTITDSDTLLDELDQIRERGYSFNREEQLKGIKAVGVPVTGPNDEVIGAFSVASPANRLTGEWFSEELPNIVLGVANEFELEYSLS